MKRLKKTLMMLLSLLMCFNCVMTVSADEESEESSDPSGVYTVHYEFVSDDPEEELPEGVMALIPEDLDGLEEGDEVENLPLDDVVTEEDVYVFLGWSEDKLTVGKEDLTIVGTWKKKAPEADEISGNNDTDEPEEGSSGTCCVEYVFLKYGTFFSDGLPKEVMALLPETENIPLGQDPDLPEFGITAGFQFKGWDKVQISYDDGSIRTVYYGFWDRLLFGVIPVSGNPGYPGAVKVITGGPIGVPGSAVPSYSLNGHTAYCVRPDITGYPVTGTSYYRGGSYGTASASLPERVANVMITGAKRGASAATIQAAVWDALGSNHGVSWRDYYDSSITAWGEVWESYLDPSTGLPMQDLGYATGYASKGGKIRVSKTAAAMSIDYMAVYPESYSLAGAEYTAYSDPACIRQVGTMTTGSNGMSNEISLESGTYYVKETKAPKGFLPDPTVYTVTVSTGKTETVASSESPILDAFQVTLHKKDARDSRYGIFLDEAEFTLKYYVQTDKPSGAPKYTWVFKPLFDPEGKALIRFDQEHYVGGDPISQMTDSQGRLLLPLGTFTIEETKAPRLFARDENIYAGRIENIDGRLMATVEGSDLLEVENEDLSQSEELQTVSLIVQKVDEETGKAELPTENITATATLKGAVFHVYRIGEYSDDPESPQIIDIDPIDYGTIVTDETGRAELKYEPGTEDGLLPGRFRIVEEKAPNGFALNTDEFMVEASVKAGDTASFEYALKIGDRLTCIQVDKIDQKGDPIDSSAEAIIQLIETDSGEVVYEFKANGRPHRIRGLSTLVRYHLHEKSVHPEYRLAEDKEVHVIDESDGTLHGSNDPEHHYTNYYRMVDGRVEIHTTATFDPSDRRDWEERSGKNHAADGVAKIRDEVSYRNVYAGDTYILEGELWDKTDNRSLGNAVRKEFTPRYDVGVETLEFSQDLEGLEEHDLVVFETLYHLVKREDGSVETVKTAEHKNIDDEGQTVHVKRLYKADMVMYKTDASRPIRLDGAVFSVRTKRIRRDGTPVEKDLGRFVTGGIYYEQEEAFRFRIATDEEMTDIVETADSAKHGKFGTQYVQFDGLQEGIYYGQVEGSEEVRRYRVEKGMIYLEDQAEDTEIIYHEEIAPGGYFLPQDDFVVNVGHDDTRTRIENERPNQAIIIRFEIPKTGIEGHC